MPDNLPPGQSDDLRTLREGRLRGFKDVLRDMRNLTIETHNDVEYVRRDVVVTVLQARINTLEAILEKGIPEAWQP